MSWKEFLKPDWRKIVVFIIPIIIGIIITHPSIYPELSYSFPFLPFPLEVVSIVLVHCPEIPENVIADCAEKIFIYPNILLNFIVYYLFSCLIVWIYDKVRKK